MMQQTLQLEIDLKAFGWVLLVTALDAIAIGMYAPQLLPCLAMLVAILFVLSRPEYAYYLFIAVMPIHCFFISPGDDHYRHILISDLMLVCSVVSWFVSRMSGAATPYPGTSCDWPWIFFYFWAVLTLSWTPNLQQGCYEIIKLIGCILAFVLTVALLSSRVRLKYALYIFIATGILTSLLAIASIYASFGVNEKITTWHHLSFYNYFWTDNLNPLRLFFRMRGQALSVPHTTSLYINIAFFFAVGFFFNEKRKKNKLLWILSLGILMTGMLSTLTKSALGSLWLGMAFFFAHLNRLKGWLVTCLVLMIAGSMLLFVLARLPEIGGSVKYSQAQMDANAAGSSLGDRLTLWKTGVKKLGHTYGIGYGAGGFLRLGVDPVPDGTHPAILFDYGIIGFFLWCFIYFNAFIEFYVHLKTLTHECFRRFFLAYLSGYLMMLVIWTVTLHYDYVDLYVYLGIGYALMRISKQEISFKEHLPFGPKMHSLVRVPFLLGKD